MIELPDKKKCFSLPEQVAQNLRNITFLAEQYKNIDALPAIWQVYKEEFDSEIETFEGWTTTFEGWDNTLSTYLANMSSAAVGAIAGQNIAPASITATSISGISITADSIIENMSGYTFSKASAGLAPLITLTYIGVVKTGNKITFVCAGSLSGGDSGISAYSVISIGNFGIPSAIGSKLYPMPNAGSYLSIQKITMYEASPNSSKTLDAFIQKNSNTSLNASIATVTETVAANKIYDFRFECTFLLSDSLY